jgi:L-asparaginase
MVSTKKILIIFCGGTISMHKNEANGSLDVSHGADQFFKLEPRIIEIAQIDVVNVSNIDSTDLDKEQWEKIVESVKTNYSKYDGFVVTHGTNTMAYTASALSYAFEQIGKPVVLTGAQIPAEMLSTDGRNNLVNALRVATMDLAGVYIVFGSKVLLGCRSKKISESSLDAFSSFKTSDVGEIGVGIKLEENRIQKRNDKLELLVKNGFNDNIMVLTCVPGINPKHINKLIENGIEGLVIRGYGPGDLPHKIFDSLKLAQEKHVPVLVTTQASVGSTAVGVNSVGKESLEFGVIQVFDMSMEAMTTKLMWLLNQGIKYENIKKEIQTNLRGEVDNIMAKIILKDVDVNL